MGPVRAARLLPFVLLVACGGGRNFEKTPTPVRVQPVLLGTQERGHRYSAHLEAVEQVSLAFRVGGYVERVLEQRGPDGKPRLVQRGDPVKKGAVLARLRGRDYEAGLTQARSGVAEAEAGLEKARRDHERAEKLYQTRSLTRADYDAAQAAFDAAQARVAAARAGAEGAASSLDDTGLRAPLSGTLLERSVEVGQLVGSGTVGFVLADTTSVKAVVGVPDTLVAALRSGMLVDLVTESMPGRPFRGAISAIAPAADPQSRVFRVEVTVPNPEGALKVGMIATVELAPEEKRALPPAPPPLVAPLAAVVRCTKSPSGYAVFVVEGESDPGLARERPVELGQVYGNRIGVRGELHAGDRVVVTGAALLVDGESVRIIP